MKQTRLMLIKQRTIEPTTKTQASRRKIIMSSHIMRLLSQLRDDEKMRYVVFGEFYDHVSTTTLDRKYEQYVKAAGVKKIRLHDFRHSHASYLINKNIMVSVIAQRLGHSDVATTLNTYSHLYPTTEKEAVLKMEDDFTPAQVFQFDAKPRMLPQLLKSL
ncbi:site-specific integrase [Salibacterium aidingense]|uniref:site-specific integrase n=1 Tax=Salibacterium aidingense TaxID=384933 RepID=UPI003899054A